MRQLIILVTLSVLFFHTLGAQNIPGVYTSAGPGQSICASWGAYLIGYMGDSVANPVWMSSGDGTFSDSNALITTYTPGPGDIAARSAILVLKATHINLNYTVSDDMILTIVPSVPSQPTAVTGAPATACPPLEGIILRTIKDPAANNYVWSSVHPGVNFIPPSSADTQSISLNAATSAEYVIKVTAFNLCGASPARAVHIRRILSVTGLKGDEIACSNTTRQYSCNSIAGAVAYKWKSTGKIRLNNQKSPLITADTVVNATFPPGFTSGSVSVAAMTPCYTGAFKTIPVSESLPALSPVSGISSVCPVTTSSFSVTTVPGTSYCTWTLPPNTTGSSTTDTISINFANSFADTAEVCVTATSICGMRTLPSCKTIFKGPPEMPGDISGPVTGLCGQTVSYSVAALPDATYYWTVPSGAIVNGAHTGNSIGVTIPTNMNTGHIRVSAVNNCGTSAPQNLTIKGSPPKPGNIATNKYPVYAFTAGVQFTANRNVTESTSTTYTWSYPSSATYLGGQGTTSLLLNWGDDNGIVTLTATNSCGSSSKDYFVNVNPKRETGPQDDNNNNDSVEKSKVENTGSLNLQAYPDADEKTVTFTFNAAEAGTYSYSLYDDSNREVSNGTMDAEEGVNMQELDMASLPANTVYRLKLDNGTNSTHINIKMR